MLLFILFCVKNCPKYTNTESIVVNGENIVFHSSSTVWHKGTLAEWTFADTLIWT